MQLALIPLHSPVVSVLSTLFLRAGGPMEPPAPSGSITPSEPESLLQTTVFMIFRKLFRPNPSTDTEPLTLDFIPSLVSRLIRAEQDKGKPLEEHEVIQVRDSARVIRVPLAARNGVWIKRGYRDIDPENVWEDWLAYRNDQRHLDIN